MCVSSWLPNMTLWSSFLWIKVTDGGFLGCDAVELMKYQYSGGIYFLHLEDGGSRFSETLLFIYKNTQRHMPVNHYIYIHRCVTLKSHTILFVNKCNHSTPFHVDFPISLLYILRLVTFICLFASLCQSHRSIHEKETQHETDVMVRCYKSSLECWMGF
jgi:hypothetical protein